MFNRKDAAVDVVVLSLLVAVFGIDYVAPLGIAVWVIYLLPLFVSYLARSPVRPVVTAFLAAAGIVAGYFTDTSNLDADLAATNRTMGVIVILLLGAGGFYFVRFRAALRLSDWLQQGQVAVGRAAEGERPLEAMADRVLAALAERIGARAAVFYVRDGNELRRAGAYGLPEQHGVPETVAQNEGHLWRCLSGNKAIEIADLGAEALPFGSALVRGTSAQALLVPVHVDGRANGVIEFGLAGAASQAARSLMERVSDQVGIAVRSARDRARLRELLEETRRQSEELKAHSEELAATNEELEEQTRALQDSQQRLEQQQAALEEQNTQLESQTSELELQRDSLARSERLLGEQAETLERESRYKSEFVANMSHELRTPLNALLIMARLLHDNRDGTLTAQQLSWAETIESSGKDLLALINDILDLSKIESGKLEMAAEPVRPADLVARLMRTFTPQAASKRLSLDSSVAEDLGAFSTDPGRLEQILRNFLSNAIKFTDKGGVSLTVRRDGDEIVFDVKDSGIGIRPDEQEVIFEAFRQADGTISRKFGGTGLGLSISRQLAAMLGGEIGVESAPGQGSTFTLRLPLTGVAEAKPVPAARPKGSAPVQPTSLPKPEEGLRYPAPMAGVSDDREQIAAGDRIILAVEDDPAFARILVDLAHELGFRCLVAGSAEDGVLAARQFLPQAIVLDVGLPDHSGLSVLDRLKRDIRTRHIPVHMVSAQDSQREALQQGAANYIMKPVTRDELLVSLKDIGERFDRSVRRVLIVEDDPAQLEGLKALLGGDGVETVGASTAAEGLETLRGQSFDCMVLDMTLPDASGFDVLETLDREEGPVPPVIVYTARELTEAEELRLRRHSRSIIIKGAKSPERLIDEVTLFLHQVVSELPAEQREMLNRSLNRDSVLDGRRILVVEDDIRNIYALTGIFEPHGVEVQIARNGREALEHLGRAADSAAPPVDLMLMDVMMPEMDGLTATREIRAQERWKHLPIIMLTAKAMADDQEQCLAAGANDYVAKPLDVDKLLSLTRVWMPR
ncbi:MAG: response regulator [Pseudooceanicola sp.]|nr:response regulator [Pseudooceanicola sp.]